MEDKKTNNWGNYIVALVGASLLTMSSYKLFNGFYNGFEFHGYNMELRGTKAIIMNVSFILISAFITYAGIQGIKRAK